MNIECSMELRININSYSVDYKNEIVEPSPMSELLAMNGNSQTVGMAERRAERNYFQIKIQRLSDAIKKRSNFVVGEVGSLVMKFSFLLFSHQLFFLS